MHTCFERIGHPCLTYPWPVSFLQNMFPKSPQWGLQRPGMPRIGVSGENSVGCVGITLRADTSPPLPLKFTSTYFFLSCTVRAASIALV